MKQRKMKAYLQLCQWLTLVKELLYTLTHAFSTPRGYNQNKGSQRK